MTVAALSAVASYLENGVTTAFAVPFRFKSPGDLRVERIAGGIVTRLTLGADYAVTGGATDAGGTVTRTAATNGATLRIRRVTDRAQPMVYTSGDRFPARSHEEALDRQMLIAQEQDATVADLGARALTVPPGEAQPALPARALRIGGRPKFIGVNEDTGAFEMREIDPAYRGPAGGSNNTRQSLTEMKAAAIADKTSLYDGSLWTFTSGDYTGQADDLTIVKADSIALSIGAWVRQKDAGISTGRGGSVATALEGLLPNVLEAEDVRLALQRKQLVTNVAVVPIGSFALPSQASITAYSNISGYGDQSVITVPADTKGIAYTSQSGVFDDHPHNLIHNLRLSGDGIFAGFPNAQNGTSTGISFAEVDFIGSLGAVEGTVLERHAIGRHIKSSFGHTGRRNYYRANKIGLKLERVTSFTEYDIYARYNSTAAVQIVGGQNVSLRGGAIEGNPGKGIEYIDDGSSSWGQVNIQDVYFETNGDQAGGVWSIDVPFNAKTMVNINGGSLWTNSVSGRLSGPYRFGDCVDIQGANINASFYAREVVGFRNCRGPGPSTWNTMPTEALSRLYGLTEPAVFHEFRPACFEYVFNSAATGGFIVGSKLMGKGNKKFPVNLISPTYPYGLGTSSGATSSENTVLDYGDGSFCEVAFDTSAGDFSNNYASLATFPDQSKQFRVFCAMFEPEAACEVGFIMSIGGQSVTGYYALKAGARYRLIFAGFAPMTAPNSVLRMFPLDASGPTINVLPLWQSQHATYRGQLKVLEMLVEGSL